MKLKYTTKVFIVVNLIIVAFRTLQIMFLTESETGFLKPDFLWLSIIGTVFCILSLAALFVNSVNAVRQPEHINCKGIPSAVASGISGALFFISGFIAFKTTAYGSLALFLTSALIAVFCVLCLISALTYGSISKPATFFPIVFWLLTLVLAYIHYTEHPLRVRTVYEVFAVCTMLLFSVIFGKAVSGVKPEKNFRLLYPFGLMASTLCIASVVPEFLNSLFGYNINISASPVMPLALVAGALFSGFFTINTFKKSNTIHPKRKQRIEKEETIYSTLPKDIEI